MLSDREIIRRLISDDPRYAILISPLISAPEQIGPSSIDVHLGTEFLVVERSDRGQFDPLMGKSEYKEWLKHVRSTNRYSVLEKFILHPFEFALAATLEFIVVPPTLVAHIDGRSSWARQGLKVHATAGNVHPGSRGPVVFELENAGPVPIVLYPGLAIAQLTFETIEGDVLEDYDQRPQSSYSGVLEMLWSTYPDDNVLRAMRRLKGQHSRTGTFLFEKPSESESLDEQFLNMRGADDEQMAQSRDADLLEMISGAIDAFERQELLVIAEPLSWRQGPDQLDFNVLPDESLRELIRERSAELARTSPAGLGLLQKVVAQCARQMLDTSIGGDKDRQ